MSRYRAWCFTVNNWTEDQLEKIMSNDKSSYVVVGKEVGEKGTPHLQGYIEFKNARTLAAVTKIIGKGHLETRRGSATEAATYCKKDGDWLEAGKMSNQGQRTDLLDIKEKILNGMQEDEVIMEHTAEWCRYRNGLRDFIDVVNRSKKRDQMTKGIWLHGETGVGKTHKAFEIAGDDYFLWTDDNGWWDGYKGQRVVIINDFRGGIKYSELLALVDKWDCKVRRRSREPMPFTSE